MDLLDTHQWLKSLSMAQLQEVAIGTGVSRHTLYKISRGLTANPGVNTLAKVAEYRQAAPASEAA